MQGLCNSGVTSCEKAFLHWRSCAWTQYEQKIRKYRTVFGSKSVLSEGGYWQHTCWYLNGKSRVLVCSSWVSMSKRYAFLWLARFLGGLESRPQLLAKADPFKLLRWVQGEKEEVSRWDPIDKRYAVECLSWTHGKTPHVSEKCDPALEHGSGWELCSGRLLSVRNWYCKVLAEGFETFPLTFYHAYYWLRG